MTTTGFGLAGWLFDVLVRTNKVVNGKLQGYGRCVQSFPPILNVCRTKPLHNGVDLSGRLSD